MAAAEWWDRQRAEADRAMAVQRQRHREMQEHPPSFIALLNRHPWITRMCLAFFIVAEFAFGATVSALVSICVLATLYFWRWVSSLAR